MNWKEINIIGENPKTYKFWFGSSLVYINIGVFRSRTLKARKMLGQETLKTWTCWVKKPENPKNLVSKTLKTKKFRVKKPCKTQTFWVRFLVYSGFCTLCGSYQNWLRPSKPQTILGQETLKSLQISVGFQVLFGVFGTLYLEGDWDPSLHEATIMGFMVL